MPAGWGAAWPRLLLAAAAALAAYLYAQQAQQRSADHDDHDAIGPEAACAACVALGAILATVLQVELRDRSPDAAASGFGADVEAEARCLQGVRGCLVRDVNMYPFWNVTMRPKARPGSHQEPSAPWRCFRVVDVRGGG